jgi:hypothetical protein
VWIGAENDACSQAIDLGALVGDIFLIVMKQDNRRRVRQPSAPTERLGRFFSILKISLSYLWRKLPLRASVKISAGYDVARARDARLEQLAELTAG